MEVSMLHFAPMGLFKKLFFILLILIGLPAFAAVVPNLYNAQIPVASQTAADRPAAIKAAYQMVLIKVTGNANIMQNAKIRANAAHAEEYIQQYSYQTNTDTTSNNSLPYQLLVQFDPEAINHTLLAAKLPIWGQDRPLTIFWIANTVNGEQRLLSASDDGVIPNALDKAAQVYGLPILLPILDLNDLNQLSVTDVVGRFVAPVVQASVRYGSNAIVMINIQQQNNQWVGLWTLVTDNAPQSWQVQDADINNMMADGMEKLVGLLAQQFALKGASQQSTINLEIKGITDLNAYARASRYLQRLATVKKVTLVELTAQQATFQLNLAGDSAALQKAISLDPTLTPVIAVTQTTASAFNAAENPSGDLPMPLTPAVQNPAVKLSSPDILVYQWTP
jgi:uncharacterized protein